MDYFGKKFRAEKGEPVMAVEEEKKDIPPKPEEGRFEYLRPDINPIMAAVGSPADFKEYPDLIDNAEFVDYYGSRAELNKKGFSNGGDYSYVFSIVDSQNKFSDRFKDCTGLLVAGQDKITGENISFLSHQDPRYFLSLEDSRQMFIADLRQRLKELKDRCVPGTVDARIVGGNINKMIKRYEDKYLKSIELLSVEASAALGFEPIVVMGPKATRGDDDVFYDNKNRRLYIVRSVVDDATSESFTYKELSEQKEKWKNAPGRME